MRSCLRPAGLLLLLTIFQGTTLQSVGAAEPGAQSSDTSAYPKLSATADWPWWRGPSRNGVAAEGSFPGKFKEADAKWKASVPGRGHSSPVVVGDRVFLTTAEMNGQKQFVLAYNRETGKPLWKEQ